MKPTIEFKKKIYIIQEFFPLKKWHLIVKEKKTLKKFFSKMV